MSDTKMLPGSVPLDARDYFAGLALQAWVSTWTFVGSDKVDPEILARAARIAYDASEAMLREKARRP